MDALLSVLAVILGIGGVVGSVIPVVPGVLLGYAGVLCALFRSGSELSSVTAWIWLAAAVAVSVADYLLPAYMTKLFGGSRAATIGATVGLFAGLFFTPIGMLLGTFLGAVAGELLHRHDDFLHVLKVGTGSFLSFIVGTGLKLTATTCMLFIICRDIFPAVAEGLARLFEWM